ncbi:MAG: hypothetical protein GF418_13505 [Chitinivibrionales bacterium]|nr:hypothetical protein [Chitinivibrionales bacterium]MBD3396636.1 hypothetical protein [Chitinivibrionales bacterium]
MVKQVVVEEPVVHSSFATDTGARESYLIVGTEAHATFAAALEELDRNYARALEQQDLTDDTLVFTRVFLSDIQNQKDEFRSSKIYTHIKSGAVSIIEQTPLQGGAVSLLCYHISDDRPVSGKAVLNHSIDGWRNGLVYTGMHYAAVWTGSYAGYGDFDAKLQTQELLTAYSRELERQGMSLLQNGVRTWIYVRDIDNHYGGMVRARREFFEHQGLTTRSRFLASTGIEGKSKEIDSLVTMDALSYSNLQEGQIERMEALDNMSPTIRYGVTFERGLRVKFGDRSHLYVSGTASIDRHGDVLHIGDIRKQTERAIDNVRALLSPHNATLNDMAYLIVYLRDPKFLSGVMEIAEREVPAGIPLIAVRGSVCRPTWLVEFEGVGIVKDSNPYPPFI